MPPDDTSQHQTLATMSASYTREEEQFAAVDLSETGYESESWSTPALFVDYDNLDGKRGDRIPLRGRFDDDRPRHGRLDEELSEYDDAYMDDVEQPAAQGLLGGLARVAKRHAKRTVPKPAFLMCGLAVVLVLIVLASIASNGPYPDESVERSSRPNITLGHVFNYTFGPRFPLYQWENGNDGDFSFASEGSIYIQHVEQGNKSTLLQAADAVDSNGNRINFRSYKISRDLQYILLETDHEKGWRHSFFANYWVWNVADKKAEHLTTSKSDKSIPGEIGSGKVALALWSPSGHHVAWVRDNDLYVTMDAKTEVRITTDGSKDIINGIADWVYEEEVLGTHDAMWFSPGGTHLAYLKFNETLVPEYHLQYYEKNQKVSYPEEVSIKYPKPGAQNPVVSLHVATPSSPNATGLDVPVEFDMAQYFPDDDRLIVEVNWVREDAMLVRMTNRIQSHQKLFLTELKTSATGATWKSNLVRQDVVSDNGWINRLQPIVFVPPSKAVGRQNPSYLEVMEDENGYAHIAYFSTVTEVKPTAWLTSGLWEIADIVGIDGERGIVYFTSTERGPSQRHLYSVHLDGSNKHALTPPMNYSSSIILPPLEFQPNGTTAVDPDAKDIGYYTANFSPRCAYYLLQYRGPDIPWSRVVKADGSWFQDVADNQRLRDILPLYAVPKRKFFQIPSGAKSDGKGGVLNMNVQMQVPYDFDPHAKKKYPVLMRVYGGPNSQLVQQSYSVDFMTAVTSAGGFISIIVDGRGTGFMGRAYRSTVANHLGSVEVEDQIAAAQWLRQQPYVDASRIAIWGWSYGGYMATKVVEANSGLFAVGMAVAPVTDWRYYDSIYTERYMKTPRMNPEGYDKSMVREMEGFEKTKFLLVHGTADDNVHFQNTASLVWRLTGNGIRNYRVQVYTDSDHSMSAGGANREVYVLLWDFVMEAFGERRAPIGI
ncbi:hypothetical protein, variant [Spizellomyces punctatus DAOM BR117]|uniref:Dipeptidyl-peptidase IV n=1 Tax=Spizellomyces punctatus (strain DAOM BR117) TaxID=645134 RepID=A0A0L0HIP4_SPIPD|nr:hypothetical protein, variant [Spizellomyces punctatus DAOM BR117]KND00689.1 hypothetical protein, variant [Spizellomyces punctatus DAOM BR117]|eukprot:XP_016608728.1 hypothetical protein, variant [Spizellomyces punctatus DAOM BR117]